MSLTVTQRPNQNGVYVAAKNPVIYKMTRKDFTWTLLITSAGNTSIRIAGNVTANFVAGDIIWLEADDGAYSAAGTVVSSAFGTYTTVVTTVPYVADNAAGYINTITKRANYYVNVEVWNAIPSPDEKMSEVNYYPNKKGLLTIDISQPLQSEFYPYINQTSIPNGIILAEDNVFRLFYIKYTEIWTGSANSATDDSGNASNAIYGAKQIGQDSYYASYFQLAALSKFDYLRLAIGEYYCLSWIWQGGTGNWIKKSWYDAAGTLLLKTYIKNTNNGGATHVDVYTLFQKLSLTESIRLDRNIATSGSVDWSSNSLTLSTGTTSKAWSGPLFIAKTNTAVLNYDLTLTGNATNATIRFDLIDSSGGSTPMGEEGIAAASGNVTGSISVQNVGLSDSYFVGIYFINNSGANKTLTINSLTITIPSTATRIDFSGVELASTSSYSELSQAFAAITGKIMPCTKNPVTLFWRNSLGGESAWTFNFNQDLLYKFQDPYKNKWQTVYDNDLTLAQYNALNDLFTLGQIYQTPIIELTTSIDKTEARIGQQVYVVDSSGNKMGVIVIPQENKTVTKRNKHNFQATIELPEIFG